MIIILSKCDEYKRNYALGEVKQLSKFYFLLEQLFFEGVCEFAEPLGPGHLRHSMAWPMQVPQSVPIPNFFIISLIERPDFSATLAFSSVIALHTQIYINSFPSYHYAKSKSWTRQTAVRLFKENYQASSKVLII